MKKFIVERSPLLGWIHGRSGTYAFCINSNMREPFAAGVDSDFLYGGAQESIFIPAPAGSYKISVIFPENLEMQKELRHTEHFSYELPGGPKIDWEKRVRAVLRANEREKKGAEKLKRVKK